LSTTAPTAEKNLALAREYVDRVFNAHEPELAVGYLTPNVKWHGGTLGTIEGPDNVVALVQGFIGGLPDLNAVEQDAFDGGKIAEEWAADDLTAILHDIGLAAVALMSAATTTLGRLMEGAPGVCVPPAPSWRARTRRVCCGS
jgi:hypothetical protein